MKKITVLLCIALSAVQVFCQQDCSIEEYALLQDKPTEISNMVALDVIQGRSKYVGIKDLQSDFYHIQTFPYPLDSSISKKQGWTIVGISGHRHWESQSWVTGIQPRSPNKTFLFFLCVAFIISMILVLGNKPDWEMNSIGVLKNIKKPKSLKEVKNIVTNVGNSIISDIWSAPVLVPILVAAIVTAVSLFIMVLVIKSSHDFIFLDFIMRTIAFTIAIYAGTVTGRCFLFLKNQIKVLRRQKSATVVA